MVIPYSFKAEVPQKIATRLTMISRHIFSDPNFDRLQNLDWSYLNFFTYDL